jgi:hypothetical protein
MPKRNPSNTATNQIKTFQNVLSGDIQPPPHITLREGDYPFWLSIVRARSKDSWNSSDLENAANLARCKADIERLQEEITAEGDIVENAKGTQIVNPKHTLLEQLSRRAMAISRMLHVHAEATVGNSRDSIKSLEKQNEAINIIAGASDGDLLARPN